MSRFRSKQEWKRYKELALKTFESTALDEVPETPAEKKARIERLKKDYKAFVAYYFPQYADSETPDFHVKFAKKVKRNKRYKGWAMWGRGLAKSVTNNIMIPLWLWANNDIKFMVLIGQNEDKAKILLADLQVQFESNQRLINDFGEQKNLGSWEDGFFRTKSGFIAKALGMGQDPRGLRVGSQRPDYISADDWETRFTAKNPKMQDELAQWLLRSVLPAMDNGNRRVVISQNYFAPRIIFSIIIEQRDSWDVDRVDAYNPVTYEPRWKAKYERWFFKEVEKEIGTLAANAEYNNTPHVEGKIFKDEHIQWAKLPRLDSFKAIVGTWDVAFSDAKTADYNAVRVWGLTKDNKKYLIDCYVKQSKVKDALEWIADFQKNLPKTVKVPFRFESQFWNEEIYSNIEEVEKKYGITLNLSKSQRSRVKKFDRILEMHPQYQNGKIYYNEKLKNHNDTQVGLAQLKGIEPGYKGHDDAPDADKEAFDYLDKFRHKSSARFFRSGRRENRRF